MLKQTMNMKATQEIVLAPAVILRSELLSLPLLHLENRIKQELEENPFLDGSDNLETIEGQDKSDEKDDDKDSEKEDKDLEDLITTFSNYDDNYPSSNKNSENEREFQYANQRTLKDSLIEQLSEIYLEEKDYEIAVYIIDNLDNDGLFKVDLDTVKETFKDLTEDKLDQIISRIQTFEPLGIASRNTKDALISQLVSKELHMEDSLIVLRDHFDNLFNKRFSVIMKDTGISEDQMHEIIEEIKTLNPKPGSNRLTELWEKTDSDNAGIIPDFIVREVDGEPKVMLNNSSIPNLYINKQTEQLILKNDPKNSDAKEFAKKKIQSAKWFINAVQQRRVTLRKVMLSILEKQKDFFLSGPNYLKPMGMKEIAEDIQMDTATVSRSSSDKYVDTEFGIFSLRSLFTERSSNSEGEEISTNQIKNRLNEIIASENKKKPYSDQKLSELLAEEGFKAARRTVMKYREQLNYPSARLRKEI